MKFTEMIASGNLPVIEEELSSTSTEINGFSPIGGITWLGYAALKGQYEVVKYFLEAGADPNLGGRRDGVLPISVSARYGNYEIFMLLFENNSKLETETSDRNPLFSAVVGKSVDIVRSLIELGFDLKPKYKISSFGEVNAFEFAIIRRELKCAELIGQSLYDENIEVVRRRIKDTRQHLT